MRWGYWSKTRHFILPPSQPPFGISWVWSFRRFFTLIFYFFPMHFFNTQQHVEENLNLKGQLQQHIAFGIIRRWEYCNPWRVIRYQLVYESAIEITIWFEFSLDFVDFINFFCESNQRNFKISRTMWFSPPGTCDVGF